MSVDSFYREAFAITPSDTLLTEQRADGIYVGGAGDITLSTEGGNTVVFKAVPVGTFIRFSTEKVMSTGTTATNLLGLVLNPIYGLSSGDTASDIFIYNDSGVAVTDVVFACQKSGTDKYNTEITNVSAGSFDMTVWTTGGTTTEQPVFNFVVIKAVAA